MPRIRYRLAFQFLALGVLGAAQAHAGFSVQLDSTDASGGSGTDFNYTASITGNDSIVAGDYFKITDFSGLIGTPTAPAGWTASVEKFDPKLPNITLSHGDDPAVTNLVFTYNGAKPVTGTASLTGFSADSVFSTAGSEKNFYGITRSLASGFDVIAFGDVKVPTFGLPYPVPAPEPSSVISIAIGVAGFGLAYARRRQARRAAV